MSASSASTVDLAHNPAWGKHLAGVDGLRAVACALVVLGHTLLFSGDYPFPAGRFQSLIDAFAGTGLTLFFVLSGFLLYRPFVNAIIKNRERPSALRYLHNRAFRILPAYWVILLVVGLVLGVAVLDQNDALLNNDPAGHRILLDPGFAGLGTLTDPGLLVRNLFLVQTFAPDSIGTGISPAWSLGCEIVFYLSLPLLVIWAAHLAHGRRHRGRVLAALAPTVLLFLVGVASKLVATATERPSSSELTQHWGSTWHAVFERSFLAQADMFAYGMAAAVIVTLVSEGRLSRLRPRVVAVATGTAFFLFILGLSAVKPAGLWWGTMVGLMFVGLLLTVMLERDRTRFRALLGWRPVAYFGVISYSVYLWHLPIIFWLRSHNLTMSGRPGAVVTVPLVFLVTIALSSLTYRYVEAPAMRRKLKLEPSRPRMKPRPKQIWSRA